MPLTRVDFSLAHHVVTTVILLPSGAIHPKAEAEKFDPFGLTEG
jgi:hypothetical protein